MLIRQHWQYCKHVPEEKIKKYLTQPEQEDQTSARSERSDWAQAPGPVSQGGVEGVKFFGIN